MMWHEVQFAVADALEAERKRRGFTITQWLSVIASHRTAYEYLRDGTREVKLSRMIDMLERAGLRFNLALGSAVTLSDLDELLDSVGRLREKLAGS